jgi:hypothetical protein
LVLLPWQFQKSKYAILTDRNVYVIKNSGLTLKARRVLLKAPRGTITAEVAGSGVPGRYLQLGDQKLWIHFASFIRRRAEAIAAGASGAPPADAAPARGR